MIQTFADWLTYEIFQLTAETRLAGAVHFFIYDVIKILLMLTVIIFAVSVIRSFFPPEKVKKVLARKNEFVGNVLAALLGIVTPFCSCSAVPLFIGFVESGVPLGVTFSFLISSPMVNEVALIMLWGLFGWKIALIYIGTGLLVAIVAGIIIGQAEDGEVCPGLCLGDPGRQCRDVQSDLPEEASTMPAIHTLRTAEEDLALRGDRGRHSGASSTAMSRRTSLPAGPGATTPSPCRWRWLWVCRLHQCRRGDPDRSGADGKGHGHRHGAGLHDGGHGPVAAGGDHSEERVEDKAPGDLRVHPDRVDHCRGLFI